MFGKAKGSPFTRRVPDLEPRADRLIRFENWREPIKVDFESVLGESDWEHYWSLHDKVVNDMKAAQQVANGLRKRVEDSLHAQRRAIEPQFLEKDETCEAGKTGGSQ